MYQRAVSNLMYMLHSVIKISSIIFHFSLLKHEYTIILYQLVSYACGFLYSVMILLHIGYDGGMLGDNEACQ